MHSASLKVKKLTVFVKMDGLSTQMMLLLVA
jgi:hypothetical protein